MRKLPVHLDAVSIQPSWDCGRACKGCYLQNKSKANRGQQSLKWFQELFRSIFTETHSLFTTKQVTLSVDKLPADHRRAAFMEEILDIFLKQPKGLTEKHITVHSRMDLEQYGPYRFLKAFQSELDWISVSKIHNDYDTRTLSNMGPRINWNTLPAGIRGYGFCAETLSFVDHLHLLLEKPVLGQDFNRIAEIDFMKTRDFLRQHFPSELRQGKITFDPCHMALEGYYTKGWGCSSNLRKISIWPDGTVTGCPYDSGREELDHEESLVMALRDEYDWERCRIKEL